ncbi:MAG TPA: hypothetical protein VGL91_23060, partial [Acidobacteriota bacterium]
MRSSDVVPAVSFVPLFGEIFAVATKFGGEQPTTFTFTSTSTSTTTTKQTVRDCVFFVGVGVDVNANVVVI